MNKSEIYSAFKQFRKYVQFQEESNCIGSQSHGGLFLHTATNILYTVLIYCVSRNSLPLCHQIGSFNDEFKCEERVRVCVKEHSVDYLINVI